MNEETVSYTEFAASIKRKYPEYADVDDRELAESVIRKYPEYADKVTFNESSDGGAFVNFTEGSQEPQEQPSQPSEESGDDQIYSIYNQLIGGGLTPDAAKGVLANIAVETAYTFDPTIEQQGGGPGRGLVQWESGGRFDTDPINLQSFAEENDRDWRDTSTQVDFILYELDNHPEYKKLKAQLNEADSTAATQLFLEKYEKAGKPKAEERKEALTRIDQAVINKEGKPYAFELPEVSEDDYLASQRQKFEGEVSTFEAPIEYTEEKKKEIEERKNRISNMNASTYFETNEQIKQLDRQIEGGIPILSENVGQLADAKKKLEQEQRLGFIKIESETPTIENYDRVVSAVQEVKNTDRDDYNAVIDYADNYFAVMDGKVKEAIDSRVQSADPATSLDYMQTRDDAGRLIPDSDKIDATAKKVLKDLGLEGVDEKVDGRLSIGRQRLGKNIYQKIRDDLRTQVEGYIQSNAVKEKIKEEGKLKELKGEAVEKEFEKELELSAPRIQEEQQKLKDLEQRYGEKLESETASAYQKYVDAIFELDSKTKNQLASGIPEEGVMRAYRMEQKRLWNLYGDSKEAIQKDLNQRYVNRSNQIVSNIDVLTQKAAQRAAKNAKLSEEQEKRAEEIYNTAYTDVLADREQDLRVYEGRVGLPAAAINTYASELGRSLGAIGRSTGIAPLIEFGEGMQLQTPYVAEDMEDWSDLFNISKLAKTTAKLGGSMTPSLIATAGATLATGGWGGLAAGAVAGWGIETLDMTGQIYRDVYEKTGSVMKAENAAEQMAEAQIRNMYLYSFEGLPFVGKALRGLGGVGRRVLAGAAIETGTEFAQEFTQTSQEKAIQETGTWKGYGKYMTGDEAKRTFLNIAPVALLGGGGQLVSARNEKIAGKKAYDAIKNTLDIAKVTPDARNQFLLRTYQEQGPTFTNAVIGGYYNNGMIDKAQYEEMRAFVNKQAPSLTSTGRAFGLSPEETVVYSSLTNHYNKLKEAAEAIENDDIAKGVALERANNFKKETEAYLNDPKNGGAFVAVQQGGTTGKMIYMSTAEFQDYISEPGVAQSIVNGDINFYARNIESEQIKKQIIKTLTGDAIARGIITESDKSEYQAAQEGRVSTKTSGSDSTIEVREVEEVAPAVEEEVTDAEFGADKGMPLSEMEEGQEIKTGKGRYERNINGVDFVIYKDSSLEGENNWVIHPKDEGLRRRLGEEGIDELWKTKSEAISEIAEQSKTIIEDAIQERETAEAPVGEDVDQELQDLEELISKANPDFQLATDLTPEQRKEELAKAAIELMDQTQTEAASDEAFTVEKPSVELIPITITENTELANKVRRMGLSELIGKKVNLVMADRLKVGDGMMGGPFFPLMDENFGKVAWASIDKKSAMSIIRGAVNADYTVVFNMGEGAIDSNVAMMDVIIDKLDSMPAKKRNEILTEIKNQIGGLTYKTQKIDFTDKVRDAINKVKSTSDLRDFFLDFNTEVRAKITKTILPSESISPTGKLKKTMLEEGMTLEGVRNQNAEQFVNDLPQGALTMVLKVKDSQGNDVTNETAEDALMTPEQQKEEGVKPHPNYPFYIRGEVEGVLNETVPFWRLFRSKLSTINAKIAGVIEGKVKPTSAQALAAENRRAEMQASKAFRVTEPEATEFETFVSILNKAFPDLGIVTDPDQFSKFIDNIRAKKLVTSKSQKVYGAVFGGKLYLNPALQNYNTPIHEFGHSWVNAAKNLRPELYQKGMELIEGSEYVSQVKNSKAYQSIIKQLRADGATEAEIDEYIKEEALATAIGDKGESFVNAAQKKEFKTWLEKLFDFVRKLTGLSKYSAEEIQNITLDEFLQGVVVDILSGEQVFEGSPTSKTDSLQLMAKESKGDINQIVAKARENNFTDDVITRFLEKNGYKKGEIKEALEIKTDLFEAIPPAYGTAFGKNATSVYNKVKANLATTRKKADKSLQTGGGVKSYLSTYVDPAELEGYSKVLENPTINNIAKEYGKAIKTEEGKRTTKQKQLIYRVNQTINNSVGQRVVEFLQNQPEYKALEKNNEWSKTESLITETRDALGYKVRKTQKAIQDAINEVTGVTKPRAERIQVTANQLRSWAEKDSAMGAVAARKNQREIDRQKRQLRRDTVAALRDAVSIGKITTQQSVAIINKFDQINWANPASRQKFVEYFIKVAEKAENVANLQEASRLRKAIKKALKDKKKDAILRDSARRFASLDPTLVENIEDYLNLATLINQGLAPKKPAFNVNDVDIYSTKETERQEKFAEDTFRMSFENITGIDSKDLTVAEMKAMLSPEEVKDFSEQKKRDAKAAAEKLIEYYLPLAQKIASTNKDPFTGEELELEMGQADLIKRLANLDLTKLDTPSLVRVADTLNNFITNYKVGGLGTLVSEIETIEDVNKLVNQGYKARELNIYWNKKLGSLWNEYLAPIPTVQNSMFGGVNRANKVSKALKFNRVVDGVAKTEAQAEVVFKALLEKYKGKKVAGQDFISDQNMIDVGMAGYAIRRPVTDNQEIIAEEFEKRTKNLLDSIEELRQQGDSKSLKLADLYEDAYNRLIRDAANAEEVKARLNDDQRAFVDDMIAVFKSIKPLQDEVSLNVFNEILGESENYLADVYGFLDKTKRKEAAEELIKSPTGMSSFTAFANSPMTKAGNFMKQTTPNGLKGTGKYVKLNLFENASQAYRNIMLDVNTAEDIRGMYAAMKSDAFTKLIPNAKDRELFKDRIDSYILNKKGKSGVVGNEDLNKALNYWAKIATTKALGSLAQVPKQYIPVMTNTVINLGADVDLLSLLLNEDANAFIERSNKAIANRGVGSLAAIESMNTLLDKGTYDNKLASFIESAGDFYLQNFLVNPDVSIARASWMAYYKQSLRKQGLSTDIDFKNDPINQEAADYAQSMVDRQQNVSDADLQGKFFTSRETGIKVVRQMLFPFASFSTNQKARVFSDIATLNNEEATVEDKRIAARSLASTIAESVVFHSIGVGISALLYNLAAEMMGGDGDDDYIKRQLASRSVSIAKDILSPVPLFDPVVDATFNSILDAFGVEDGFRAYGRFSDLTNLDMGVYAIPIDRIRENLDAFDLAITGESGKKIISASDREAVTMAAIAMMLHNGGVLPADFQTVARNVIKQAKNKGKTQKQIEKSLRKRGGLRVSGRGL